MNNITKLIVLTNALWLPNILYGNDNLIHADEDRQVLLDNAYVIDELNSLIGAKNLNLEQNITNQIDEIDINNRVVFSDRNDYNSFRNQVDVLIEDLENLKGSNSSKEVIFPDPEPQSACFGNSAALSITLISTVISTRIALGSLEYTCLQTVAGGNIAEPCFILETLDAAASAAVEFASFCTDDANYAENTALFGTVNSIGQHMNDFLDETTISSRATQDSVDGVQDSLDEANSSLDQYLPLLDNNLNTGLTDLDLANQQLNDINSQSDSLLFRVQVNQIEIESIETLTSDIQQRSEEIRDDTQSLILATTTMQSQLLASHQTTQSLITQTNNNKIEHVLAKNPARASISYQLPASQGGLLEAAREILIKKLNSLTVLGAKVNKTEVLLAAGDDDYNNGQYKSAYTNYSNAYRALLEASF